LPPENLIKGAFSRDYVERPASGTVPQYFDFHQDIFTKEVWTFLFAYSVFGIYFTFVFRKALQKASSFFCH
jgi:hypothetical protein